MPQIHLPLFPEGATLLSSHLAFEVQEGKVTYFYGNHPVFIHDKEDLRTFRMITSQFVVTGAVKEAEIIRGFGLPPITVKRAVKLYRERGAKGFYQEKKHRGAAVLTKEVLVEAQTLLDEGHARSVVAKKIGIKLNTLGKAIVAGRLHEREKKLQKYQ
jgi:transposase